MAPSYDPNIEEATAKANRLQNQDSSMSSASRLWQKNGSCPKGTIPVQRFPQKYRLKQIHLKIMEGRSLVLILLLLISIKTSAQTFSGVIARYRT